MKKVYIYDCKRAIFYIREGIDPLCPPAENKKTGKIFFTFSKDETQQAYQKWVQQCIELKN